LKSKVVHGVRACPNLQDSARPKARTIVKMLHAI
jgi:hypothetical protein